MPGGEGAEMAYRVLYRRDVDGKHWLVSVVGVKGCHTYGNSVEQARERVREALGLFVDDAETAEFDERVELPRSEQLLVRRWRAAKASAARENERLEAASRDAINALTRDLSLTTRDAGGLLGISHQRVHQLLAKHGSRRHTSVRERRIKAGKASQT